MSDIRLPIRQLVEFLLRSGSIDSRFAGFDRALEGARIHRRLQKAAGRVTPPRYPSAPIIRSTASALRWRAGPTAFLPTKPAL